MKRLIPLVIIVFLLPLVSAQCDSFCQDEGFSSGVCRATTEEGFCEGSSDETVFGFDHCTNYERCCCSGPEEVEEVEEAEEETTVERTPVMINVGEATPKNLFWFLLILVIILGVANLIVPKKREGNLEDLI